MKITGSFHYFFIVTDKEKCQVGGLTLNALTT